VFWQAKEKQKSEAAMPTVHTLTATGSDSYDAVAHFPMPVGNNAAGVPWKTCYIASFQGQPITSRLKIVGNGPGQITQQELNQITNGDVIEITFNYGFDQSWPDAQKLANIDIYSSRAINDYKDYFAELFKYYGFTR
jgi:hypothetical protein